MSKYFIEATNDKKILDLLCNGDLKYKKGRYERLNYYEYDEIGKAISDFMKLCVSKETLHCQLHTNKDLLVDKADMLDLYDLSNNETKIHIRNLQRNLEEYEDLLNKSKHYLSLIEQGIKRNIIKLNEGEIEKFEDVFNSINYVTREVI